VSGNWIGINSEDHPVPNTDYGVLVLNGSTSNTIGGGAGERNIISANPRAGIRIAGEQTKANSIRGNYIGTNGAGSAALSFDPARTKDLQDRMAGLGASIFDRAKLQADVDELRPLTQVYGVEIENSPDNEVVDNVISGNWTGIYVHGVPATNTMIGGNRIGTDPTGTIPIGNVFGISIQDSPGNVIGDNLIAANAVVGVELRGSGAAGNQIQGNVIGLGDGGRVFRSPLPASFRSTVRRPARPRSARRSPGATTFLAQQIGVFITGASNNTIAGNVQIAGNNIAGVYILGQSGALSPTQKNVILSNRFGTKSRRRASRQGLDRSLYGVLLYNAPNNDVPQSGKGANSFGSHILGAVREFSGKVLNRARPVGRPELS
jgi:parallel beta-helix repeat protein